jgi:hypothetical protein
MYKHVETIVKAGAEARIIEMLLENEAHVTAFHPELERPFQAIRHTGAMHPGDLFHAYDLHHNWGVRGGRYDDKGIARYELYGNIIQVFSNDWFERPIWPFEIIREIIETKHARRVAGSTVSRVSVRLERIDESLHWPFFYQSERGQVAWIATKLMDGLRVPADICPCCRRGNGELVWVRSHLLLLGVIWGTGEECLGCGYVILKATREDNGEAYEL